MSNQPPKTTQPPAGLDVNTILKKKIAQTGPGGMQDPTYEPGFNIRATPTYRPLKALPMNQTPIQPTQAATDFITDWRENAYKQQFTNGQINGTKVTGPGGEALPYGAKAWDWSGSPYYGEGFWGWANKLQSKLYEPSTVTALTPQELKSISIGFSPPTDDPKAMELLKKGGYLPEPFGNGDPKFWESMYGMARFKMDQAWNYGAPTTGTDKPVLSRLPGIVGEGVMDVMDAGLQEIERLVTGSVGTGIDFATGKIQDFNDLEKTFGTYHAAGDVAPTALWDYASSAVTQGDPKSQAMAEYKRRYMAGEDPNLLAAELGNPWAEGIFDLAAGFGLPGIGWMDPLNWLGDVQKVAKTGKALAGLQDVAKLSPEMATALKAVGSTNTELDGLQAMDNVINTIAKEVQNGADEIEAAAKEIGIFAPTASSKRFQAALRQGTLMKWVATSVGKTQDAVDVIEGMYKMGRGAELMRGATDAEVVKMARTLIGEGLNQVTNIMPYADPLLGKAGAETAAVLYKILGDSPEKFLAKTLKESEGGMQNFIQYLGKTMEANEAKIFPTLTERIKAGEKFNPGIVAIDKFHNAAQKVVGRVNSAFAKVYMGLSPGFASRNMMTNVLHVMIDQGPEAVFSMDWGWGKFLEKTLGYQPGVYGVDVKSIATGEATKQGTTLWEKLKGADFTTLSNWFEKLSSQMVVTQSVKNTFKLALKEGVAIPSIKPLVDAGISQQTALQIVRLLTKYDGNVDAAMQAFRAGQKLGYIDLLSTLGHIDPKDMDLLTQLPGDAKAALIDIYQRAKTEGWTKDRTMAEINLLKEKIKDLGRVDIPQGVQITDEFGNPTVAGEVASDMGAALRGQDYEKASSTVESYVTANDNTMSSQRYVAERLVDKLKANPSAPQDMVETVKRIADGSLKEGVHQQYNSMRFFAHSTSQASYTDGFMASQEAANAWRMMGMDGAPPLDAKEFRRILWEEYYFPNVRDLYDNLIDVQQTALQNAVRFVELEPNFQPNLKELAENYTLSAAWRRVAADYSDYRQYYTALRRGQLRSANLILSNRFNAAYMDVLGTTSGTTTDRFVLDIINRYKPKAPDGTEYAPFTDLNAVDPEKITRPALSRWLRENMRTAQAAPEAVRTAETVAQATPDVVQGAENVAQAVATTARQHRAINTEKVAEIVDAMVMRGDFGNLPDDIKTGMSEELNRIRTQMLTTEGPSKVFIYNEYSSTPEVRGIQSGRPDWFGEQGMSVHKMKYRGESGAAGVIKLIDDILAGNPPPHEDTMLVKAILGLAYDSFTNPSASNNIMDMVAGNNRFSAELSRIVQQINSAKSPDEIVAISDEIEALRSNLDQYATDINGADQNAVDITAQHWDSVLNMAVEDLLNKKFPAPLPESSFVGTGNAAQDFARAMGQAYNLDADQTDQIMRINDAVANTWAAITDRPVEEFYALRIAEIRKGGIVPEGAASLAGGRKYGTVAFEDGMAIVQGFKKGNVSSAVESLARVYRRNLYSTLAEITNESERVLLLNDIRTTEKWLKIKDGVWETKHEEKFARAFEKYLRDGETSVPSLKRVFEKFKDWLKRIYTSITGTKLDMEIPAEMKAVFDNMMIEGPRPLAPVGDGATLMPNMQVRGGFDSIDELFNRIGGNTDRAWSQVVPMDGTTPEAAAALKQWETQAKKNISQLKLYAAKRAEADRSFTLLDYADKKGIDLALAYVFPYQFWYTRTYANWMKRIVSNPVILANYTRYKDMLAKAHAGAPEWWKYNLNTNELMGRNDESPLFFNLEQTLNPLNGIAGQDFTSPYAKLTWYTQMIDGLGKYGPSTWTPFSWAMAVALANEAGKGEHINPETGLPVDYETAARYYAGRLVPQTTTVKNALTLAGMEGKWGGQSGINEVDPMALLFQGGMDYYERRRAGRAAAQVVGSGQYSDAKVLEDFQTQSGPAWDAAVKASILARAGNWTQTLLPFILGVGFKARTASDIQIDKFDQEYRATWAMAATLSPDELRTRLSALKEKYPWSDAVLLSRKTGMERDRSYAYNVLSRIPPGASTKVWEAAGLRPEIAEQFYAAKGNLATMSEGDRTDFMQAVVALGAILDLPNPATRQEWDAAKTAYADMQTQTKTMFGPSIMADIDFFYNGLTTQDERDAFLAANPEVEAAMNFQAQQKQTNPQLRDFYASFETIERYYKGLMFDSLRQQFGDLGPLWDQYNSEALKGNKFKQAFWDANPILAQYSKIKSINEIAITKAIQMAGSRLNTVPLVIRQDASPQTVRQQDVMNLATSAPQETVYQMSWTELQALMSPPLARLVEDYAMRGQDLPYAAQQQLERVSSKFGITSDQFMVLVEQALQQSVATP